MQEMIEYISSGNGKKEDGRYFDYFKKNTYGLLSTSGTNLPTEAELAAKHCVIPTLIKLTNGNEISFHVYRGKNIFTKLNNSKELEALKFDTSTMLFKKSDPVLAQMIAQNAHIDDTEYWEHPKSEAGMNAAKLFSENLLTIQIPYTVDNIKELINAIQAIQKDLANNPEFDGAIDKLLKARGLDPNALDHDPGHKPLRTYKEFFRDDILKSYANTVLQGVYREQHEKEPQKIGEWHQLIIKVSAQCHGKTSPENAQGIYDNIVGKIAPKLVEKLFAADSSNAISSIKAIANDRTYGLVQKEIVFAAIKSAFESKEHSKDINSFLKTCDKFVKDKEAYKALSPQEKELFDNIHTALKGLEKTAQKTQTVDAKPQQQQPEKKAKISLWSKIKNAFRGEPQKKEATPAKPSAPAQTSGGSTAAGSGNKTADGQKELNKLNAEWNKIKGLENSRSKDNLPKFEQFLQQIRKFKQDIKGDAKLELAADNIVMELDRKLTVDKTKSDKSAVQATAQKAAPVQPAAHVTQQQNATNSPIVNRPRERANLPPTPTPTRSHH